MRLVVVWMALQKMWSTNVDMNNILMHKRIYVNTRNKSLCKSKLHWHVAWQGTPEGVEDNGSLTRVAAFPIGIDPERFQRALERVDVRSHIAELLNRYAGRKVAGLSAVISMQLMC